MTLGIAGLSAGVRKVFLALLCAAMMTGVMAMGQGKPVAAAAVIPHPALGPVPAAAQFDASGKLDVEAATRAYLDTIPKDKQADSNKYFEGGYWLTLCDALFTIAVMLVLLFSGLSAKMRDVAVTMTGKSWLQTGIYYVEFTLVTTVVGAPLSWWEGFHREHIYGMSEQSLGGWLHDQAIGLVLGLVLGAVVVTILYAIARRLPRTWHLWAAAVTWVFLAFMAMLAPVYLSPLFNTYTRIADKAVTVPILKMAHANGIPVNDLYQVDASKQTTRVSANVSGVLKTSRITLNDNLLRTSSLEEIEAVTGHEMGHYVLHHIEHSLVEMMVVILVVFLVLRGWVESLQRRRGARFGSTSIYDPALLPGVVMIVTVIFLFLTPVTNTMTRTQEHEADMFGLNASRQPDGEAQCDLKLGQYRKMEPGAVEEFIFFDHPSGKNRILDAMRWKSQNQGTLGYNGRE